MGRVDRRTSASRAFCVQVPPKALPPCWQSEPHPRYLTATKYATNSPSPRPSRSATKVYSCWPARNWAVQTVSSRCNAQTARWPPKARDDSGEKEGQASWQWSDHAAFRSLGRGIQGLRERAAPSKAS